MRPVALDPCDGGQVRLDDLSDNYLLLTLYGDDGIGIDGVGLTSSEARILAGMLLAAADALDVRPEAR